MLVKTAQLSHAHTYSSNRPCWQLSARYSDWLVILQIQHDAVETSYTLLLAVEGECSEVVTLEELKERVEIAAAHGDEYDASSVHAVSKCDGLWRVKEELVKRWEALQYIVTPSFT